VIRVWIDDVAVEFECSPRPTLGVEWEIAMVDRTTRDLSNHAGEILADVGARVGETPRITHEMLRNTVEIVTGICANAAEAVADLDESLQLVREITDAHGIDLMCSGTHPFAHWSDQTVTPEPHYARLVDRVQFWGRQMLIWGVHTHVGISSADKVFPIINGLLPHYAHLLALSASSPTWEGVDTGYASNRAMLYQQLPTAGLPYQFENWGQYESFVHQQVKSGALEKDMGMHWDIRPSPKYGTIEVRICDGISTRRELAALVALSHCLVVDADARITAGERLPALQPWHIKENKWRAARYGLDADIIVDRDTRERPLVDDLCDLLERLEPTAKKLDCASEFASVEDILKKGASYQRQRAVARENGGDLRTVVDSLVVELKD
jgi:carboxylate-amine ligase